MIRSVTEPPIGGCFGNAMLASVAEQRKTTRSVLTIPNRAGTPRIASARAHEHYCVPPDSIFFGVRAIHTNYKGIIIISLGFLLLNLIGLDRSPLVWMDEVTLNDPAKEWALHGRMASSVFAGHNGFDEAYYWQPPGQPALMALVYKIFSFGIWQTRIPGVLFGSGTLLVVYLLSLQLLGSRNGALLGAVTLGLDPKYIESARSGRMDTQCLFLALLSVYVFVRLLQDDDENGPHRKKIVLAGLFLGLAGITHPMAVAWVAALGAVTMLWRNRAHLGIFLWVVVVAAVPALVWILSVAAVGDLDLLRIQFLEHGSSRLSGGGVFKSIVDEAIRYAAEYSLAPGLLAMYFGGLIWVLSHRNQFDRAGLGLAILFAVPALIVALFMSKTVGFYFLHPVAILAIAAGAMMSALWEGRLLQRASRRSSQVFRSVLLLVLVNVLLAGIIGRYTALAYQWRQRDHRPVARALAEHVSPGSVVWGPPDIWYAVEKASASLRIRGEPDPQMHDLLVTKVGANTVLPDGVSKVGELGVALPPVFGVVRLRSTDYRMSVWAWTER